MINRELTSKIQSAATQMPIVAVTGPRQSGKSTLVKYAFPNHRYVNLENIERRNFAREDPKGFLESYSYPVVIDEVQYVPDLLSYIQLIVDENPGEGQFILTGSQNLLLMEQISQSLAGRVAIFNLLPFSLRELMGTSYEQNKYEPYVVRGSYPRIYEKSLNHTDWLLDYVLTYVEKDVRQLLNVQEADVFRQFIEICAGRIGQIVNFSDIGGVIGVNYQTVKRWISILKTSFLIYTLRPYHKNYNKRIIKSPKLYFYDTGLACALMNIRSADQLNIHFAKGALFENFVINEIMKNQINAGERPNLYFWRSSDGKEVDLIVDKGLHLFPMEMKAGKTLNQKFFKGLEYFNEISNNPPKNASLIYGGDEFQKRSNAHVFGWNHLPQLDELISK